MLIEKHTIAITTVNQRSATRRLGVMVYLSKMSITDQNVIPEPVQYVLHLLQQNGTYSQ
jgi:hypothetical protein